MQRENGNMGHTFACHLYHIVFSTKNRQALITADIKPRVLQYLSGIARKNECTILAANCTKDHVHLLAAVPPKVPVADFVQMLKGNSSRWMAQEFGRMFAWQAGYASFTVSESNRNRVSCYIAKQEEHHSRLPFEKELQRLLDKHRIPFDREHYLD